MKQFLTAKDVANIVGVDKATITRWIKKGVIEDAQRPEGARFWRIPLSSCAKLKRKQS
jgi:excisionase family DNA binding protein